MNTFKRSQKTLKSILFTEFKCTWHPPSLLSFRKFPSSCDDGMSPLPPLLPLVTGFPGTLALFPAKNCELCECRLQYPRREGPTDTCQIKNLLSTVQGAVIESRHGITLEKSQTKTMLWVYFESLQPFQCPRYFKNPIQIYHCIENNQTKLQQLL